MKIRSSNTGRSGPRKACLWLFVAFAGILIAMAGAAFAAWPDDPSVNVPLCTAPNDQKAHQVVTDGKGGAIAAWLDYRNGDPPGIYAQRVDAEGKVTWQTNGVLICPGHLSPRDLSMASDGKGGAILAWEDDRYGNDDIFAQKIDGAGVPQWPINGLAIARVAGTQSWPDVISDGSGGAFFAWRDQRTAPSDSYIQWVNADGSINWAVNGVNVSNADKHQYYPKIVRDGQGGVIVTWMDDRTTFYHWSVYAQRFSAAALPQWTTNGVSVRSDAQSHFFPQILSDTSGGAIIAWRNCEGLVTGVAATAENLYAQRVSASGAKLWGTQGVLVTDDLWLESKPIEDGSGGVIIAWDGCKLNWDGMHTGVCIQKINSAGIPQWGTKGIRNRTNTVYDMNPRIASDGQGGAIVSYEGTFIAPVEGGLYEYYGIIAQRVDASGKPAWSDQGKLVSVLELHLESNPEIVSDMEGGAVIVWKDIGAGGSVDIYCKRIFKNGMFRKNAQVPYMLLLDEEK